MRTVPRRWGKQAGWAGYGMVNAIACPHGDGLAHGKDRPFTKATCLGAPAARDLPAPLGPYDQVPPFSVSTGNLSPSLPPLRAPNLEGAALSHPDTCGHAPVSTRRFAIFAERCPRPLVATAPPAFPTLPQHTHTRTLPP